MKPYHQQKVQQYEPVQISYHDPTEFVTLSNEKLQIVERRQFKAQNTNRKNGLFRTLIVILGVIIFFILWANGNFQRDNKQTLENIDPKNQALKNPQNIQKDTNVQMTKQRPQQTHVQKPKQQQIHENKQKNYQSKIFTDQYEYDVAGKFNLWDLNPRTKNQMFRRYNSLPSNKKLIKGDQYMEINYGRDDQFLNFSKTYEENIEEVDWYSYNLTEAERVQLSNEFGNALKQRRKQIEILKGIYNISSGKQKFSYQQKKNITYVKFLQSLQFKRLTGEKIQQNLQIKKIYETQKQYFESNYHTDKPKNEIHACVVIPTYNNVVSHRYLWNLESILQQQYSNYRLIIIDDGSTDGTSLKIAQHLNWRGVSREKAVLIRNKKHASALPNVYYGIHKYCDYNQIFYTIDGDDEIIGTQVFKLFNALYQQKKNYAIYSSYYQYLYRSYNDPLNVGIPYQYPQQVKKKNGYRIYDHAYSQLRTGITDMFLLLNIKSLQNQHGEIYKVISNNALYFSAMQMSCGRVNYIPELEYWYNANTGINDWLETNKKPYQDTLKHINKIQKHYQCIHKTLAQIEVSLQYENSN